MESSSLMISEQILPTRDVLLILDGRVSHVEVTSNNVCTYVELASARNPHYPTD